MAFSSLGSSFALPDKLYKQPEAFTCLIYGGKQHTDVNLMRYTKLPAKCCLTPGKSYDPAQKFDISSLPPCRRSLDEQIKNVNFQVGIWRNAHIPSPETPDPTDDNGWHHVDGVLEPLWFSGDIPQSLIDVIVENEDILNDDVGESDDEEDTDDDSDEQLL